MFKTPTIGVRSSTSTPTIVKHSKRGHVNDELRSLLVRSARLGIPQRHSPRPRRSPHEPRSVHPPDKSMVLDVPQPTGRPVRREDGGEDRDGPSPIRSVRSLLVAMPVAPRSPSSVLAPSHTRSMAIFWKRKKNVNAWHSWMSFQMKALQPFGMNEFQS